MCANVLKRPSATIDWCDKVSHSRRLRGGGLPQEQGEARAHHLHGGAATGAAGQLPTGLQPWRAGPGADRAGHGPQQAGHAGLVPELQGEAEEAPAHWKDEEWVHTDSVI